jgi:hypothetical protein
LGLDIEEGFGELDRKVIFQVWRKLEILRRRSRDMRKETVKFKRDI